MAECYYKTVTFSAEDFARRFSSFGDPSENKDVAVSDADNSDGDPHSGSASLSSTSSRSSSVGSLSSNCQVILVIEAESLIPRSAIKPYQLYIF